MQVVAKWLHSVISFMKQNKKQKQALESAQYGLEISLKEFNNLLLFGFSVFTDAT